VFEDRVKVELAGGKILICNVDDLYFVELHNWYCTSGYAVTKLNGAQHFFHNMVM